MRRQAAGMPLTRPFASQSQGFYGFYDDPIEPVLAALESAGLVNADLRINRLILRVIDAAVEEESVLPKAHSKDLRSEISREQGRLMQQNRELMSRRLPIRLRYVKRQRALAELASERTRLAREFLELERFMIYLSLQFMPAPLFARRPTPHTVSGPVSASPASERRDAAKLPPLELPPFRTIAFYGRRSGTRSPEHSVKLLAPHLFLLISNLTQSHLRRMSSSWVSMRSVCIVQAWTSTQFSTSLVHRQTRQEPLQIRLLAHRPVSHDYAASTSRGSGVGKYGAMGESRSMACGGAAHRRRGNDARQGTRPA